MAGGSINFLEEIMGSDISKVKQDGVIALVDLVQSTGKRRYFVC